MCMVLWMLLHRWALHSPLSANSAVLDWSSVRGLYHLGRADPFVLKSARLYYLTNSKQSKFYSLFCPELNLFNYTSIMIRTVQTLISTRTILVQFPIKWNDHKTIIIRNSTRTNLGNYPLLTSTVGRFLHTGMRTRFNKWLG